MDANAPLVDLLELGAPADPVGRAKSHQKAFSSRLSADS
jgi:hypothetical protein